MEQSIKDRYFALLERHVARPEEEQLATVSELGRELVVADVPPEEVAEIHQEAICRLAQEYPDMTLLDCALPISAPLLQMLTAYGLAFSERAELRRHYEEALLRAETAKRCQDILEASDAIVVVIDKDFRIVHTNPTAHRAFSGTQVLGARCYRLFHGSKEPIPNCPSCQTFRSGEPAKLERHEPHLGSRWFSLHAFPLKDKDGTVREVVHVVRDITERKRMEEQLIVTDRLASIGMLTSGVAHELNNPLTSIIGFSDLLLNKEVPDDVKEDLMVMNREAQRTAGIVRNLLAFARKHEAVRQPVDINDAIRIVLELRAYEQKVQNIQVNTHLASGLPEIMADSFQLQQVFLNIIINAEYFIAEAHGRGTLTITTERVGDMVKASFVDDGPGIAKENLGRLFDPFFTTKGVGKGTGLGLSICHGIVTEHDGRIYAKSQLGKGATFVVELPIPAPDNGRATK